MTFGAQTARSSFADMGLCPVVDHPDRPVDLALAAFVADWRRNVHCRADDLWSQVLPAPAVDVPR